MRRSRPIPICVSGTSMIELIFYELIIISYLPTTIIRPFILGE